MSDGEAREPAAQTTVWGWRVVGAPDGSSADARMRRMRRPSGPAAALLGPVFLASLSLTFVEFALPTFGKSLGATALSIGGLYSVFTLTSVCTRLAVGRALDRHGRRPVFLIGLGCTAAAMAGFALANTVGALYLARIIQGLASALLWTSVTTIVADLSPVPERGQLMGRIGEISAQSQIVGMLAAFVFSLSVPDDSLWPTVFAVYAVMAAVSVGWAWRSVPESRPEIPERGDVESLSPQLYKVMVIAFATGICEAMIAPIYLIYLQDRFTTDIVTLAWAYLPAGLVYSFAPSRLGRLSDRWGRAPLMAAGVAGTGVLSLAMPYMPGLLWLMLLYTVAAIGWAMADPAEAALVADLAGTNRRGRAYGLYAFSDGLGGTIGPLIGGLLYDRVGQSVPFLVNGTVLLLAAIWTLIALRR